MSGIRLQQVEYLHMLWLLPLIVGLAIYAAVKRKRAMEASLRLAL